MTRVSAFLLCEGYLLIAGARATGLMVLPPCRLHAVAAGSATRDIAESMLVDCRILNEGFNNLP
jgi:hypothetical protein